MIMVIEKNINVGNEVGCQCDYHFLKCIDILKEYIQGMNVKSVDSIDEFHKFMAEIDCESKIFSHRDSDNSLYKLFGKHYGKDNVYNLPELCSRIKGDDFDNFLNLIESVNSSTDYVLDVYTYRNTFGFEIKLEYLIERSEYGKVQFNLSDYSHKNINVEHKNGCKTFHTIKSFYEDFIGFIKKLQRDNPDLLEKIDFTYDSKREFSKVLNFNNYSNFSYELSDDEYFYYRIAKILCKTFDVFSEIMKDNDKTELKLLQREVTLYRDQVDFYKKLKENK